MEVPQNGWFIMDSPIKMDDLGISPFSSILGNLHFLGGVVKEQQIVSQMLDVCRFSQLASRKPRIFKSGM